MASFIINPATNKTPAEQWRSHIAADSKLLSAIRWNNLLTFGSAVANHLAIRSQTTEIVSTIRSESNRQIAVAIENAEMIISSINFAKHQIKTSLHELATLLDDQLSAVIDQLRVGNLLGKNIAQLLRIPDFQKERQYFIEQGFKHYSNARLDKGLFEHALENLQQAEQREKTDYIILHRIGLIYLYAADLCDPAKAESYFRRAARFASVEADDAAVRLANFLVGPVDEDPERATPSAMTVRELAAETHRQLSVSLVAQGKLPEAVEAARRAVQLSPQRLEPLFQLGKSLVSAGKTAEAGQIFLDLLLRYPEVALILRDDQPLLGVKEIQEALALYAEKVGRDSIHKAEGLVQAVRGLRLTRGSKAQLFVRKLEELSNAMVSAVGTDKVHLANAITELALTPSRELIVTENESIFKLIKEDHGYAVGDAVLFGSGDIVFVKLLRPFEGSRDHCGIVRVWNTRFRNVIHEIQIGYAADHKRFISMSSEEHFLICEPYLIQILSKPTDECGSWDIKEVSRDHSIIGFTSIGDNVCLVIRRSAEIDVVNQTGEKLISIVLDDYEDRDNLTLSSDGRSLASPVLKSKFSDQWEEGFIFSGNPLVVLIRDLSTGKVVKKLVGQSLDGKNIIIREKPVLRFSADGSRLACKYQEYCVGAEISGSQHSNFIMFDVEAARTVAINILDNHVLAPAFNHDGTLLQFHKDSPTGNRLLNDWNLTFSADGTAALAWLPSEKTTLQLIWTQAGKLNLLDYLQWEQFASRWRSVLEQPIQRMHGWLGLEDAENLYERGILALTREEKKIFGKKDFSEAARLLIQAAKLGYWRAKKDLEKIADSLYDEGVSAMRQEEEKFFAKKDFYEARRLLQLAADAGHVLAKNALKKIPT
jgi:tetratricopeptide (TPR) repeat protein